MNWEEFVTEIEIKTEAIWMEEPHDLVRLRLGVVDSGAGTHGQLFHTLLFVQSEVRGLTINACQSILVCANNDMFTLDHLKIEARTHLTGRSGLLHYLGLHELGELFLRFLSGLDDVPSKEALIRILQALKTYGVRVHMWTLHSFPWHLGLSLQHRSMAEAQILQAELAKGPWSPVKYTGR
jgi:hypothetical protein